MLDNMNTFTNSHLDCAMITPKDHIHFKALKLSAEIDHEIMDCAIAFIEPSGGGPLPSHSHAHDHLFTVISGEVEIRLEDDIIPLKSGMSFRVPGHKLHSVWNVSQSLAKVLGVSLTQ
jgi:mannose-6-phosphate isomerase-like protein (cupin superfamily)